MPPKPPWPTMPFLSDPQTARLANHIKGRPLGARLVGRPYFATVRIPHVTKRQNMDKLGD